MAKKSKGLNFKRQKFVLILGEEGAVLAHVVNGKLENRLFSPSPAPADRRNMNAVLTAAPHIPIYVLLDTMEQNYTKISLPAVSSLGVGKLVKRRLERDFGDSPIRGSLLIGRETKGRRDWIYMFIAASFSEDAALWVEYLLSLPNRFAGIFMLPLEAGNMLRRISRLGLKKKEVAPEWQMLVMHNKTGGFRQVVLHREKMVFTRLIRTGKDSQPELLAGNAEQEILNTLEYLHRMGFNGQEEHIHIYTITSLEVKRNLATLKIPRAKLHQYTPHEIAQMMGIQGTTLPDDKFADLLLSVHFSMQRSVKHFYTQYTQKVEALTLASRVVVALGILLIPIFLITATYLTYDIFQIRKEIQHTENEKAEIETVWRSAQRTSNYNIEDANKISDMIKLHDVLKSVAKSPLILLRWMIELQGEEAITTAVDWTYNVTEGLKDSTDAPYALKVNMDFLNSGGSPDILFANFDAFTTRIKEKFKDFTVDHTKLPETITLDEKNRIVNMQIEVSNAKKK